MHCIWPYVFTHTFLTVFVHQPGFTTAALLSYKDLGQTFNPYLNHLETPKKQKFKINSKVLTATVSNTETANLTKSVTLTFSHLEVWKSLLLMYHIQCVPPMWCIVNAYFSPELKWESYLCVLGSWPERGRVVKRRLHYSELQWCPDCLLL